MVTIMGFRGFKCRGLGCRGQPLVVRTRPDPKHASGARSLHQAQPCDRAFRVVHLGFCHAIKEQIACFSLACVEFIGRMQTVGGLYNILYTDPCYTASSI